MRKSHLLCLLLLTGYSLLWAQSAWADTCIASGGFESILNVSTQTAPGATNGTTFGTVCVMLTNSNTATVTFTAADHYAFMDSSMADVQVNAASFTLGAITESPHPGLASDAGANNVSSYGTFNQTIKNFDGAGDAETLVSFVLTDNSGTWASAADVLIENAAGFDAAAHVICLAGSGCETAGDNGGPLTFFVGEGTGTPVPEPTSLALLGSGLIGLAGLVRRKVQK